MAAPRLSRCSSALALLIVWVGVLGAFTPHPPHLPRLASSSATATRLGSRIPFVPCRSHARCTVGLQLRADSDRAKRSMNGSNDHGNSHKLKLEVVASRSTRDYNRRMQEAAKVGDLKRLERELAALEKSGLLPDVFTLNAYLNCLSKTRGKDFAHASKAVDQMVARGVQPNTVTLNTLLKFFVSTGDISGARACLERFKARGIRGDVITSNTLLSISAKAEDSVSMHETVQEMQALGLEPSVATVTTLVKSMSMQGDVAGAEQVFRLWGAEQPAAVRCLADLYTARGQPQRAIALLAPLLGLPPSSNDGGVASLVLAEVATLNTYLKSLRRARDAEGALTAMLTLLNVGTLNGGAGSPGSRSELRADTVTLNILTDILCAAGRLPLAEACIHGLKGGNTPDDYSNLGTLALNQDEEWLHVVSQVSAGAMQGSGAARVTGAHVHQYTSLLRAYGNMPDGITSDKHVWGDVPVSSGIAELICGLDDEPALVRSLRLVGDLLGSGLHVDAVMLTTLLDVFAARRRAVKAAQLFELAMDEWHVTPGIATYNALLKALRAGGLTGQAFATIEDLRARGLKPDVVTFNTLLDAAGEAGNDTLMALVREDMRKAGIARDAATFNTEIKRCARTKNLRRALELVEEMRAEEVSPTDVTYATLADACGKAGEVGLAHEMAAKIGPNAQVQVRRMAVTALIKAHAVARDPARALEVAIEAKRSGVGIREAGWGALMDAYANVADPIKVQECIGRMEKEGMHANRVHWSILVKAHCNAGDTTAALRVMREEVRTPDVVCYNTVLNAAMRFKHLDNLIVALRDMEQSGVEPDANTREVLLAAGANAAALKVGGLLKTFDSSFRSRLVSAVAGDTSAARNKSVRQE